MSVQAKEFSIRSLAESIADEYEKKRSFALWRT